MRLMWKILLPVLIVALAVYIARTLIRNRPAPQRADVAVAVPTVAVVEAKPQDRRMDLRTHGTVQARATSALGAEVSGRIVWVRPSLAEGVLVAEGDDLLRIDDADYRAVLADAEAALAVRRQELAQEQAEGARAAREWAELGQGQPSDLVLRKPQLAAATARIAAAEAAVAKAARDLERTQVRAPYLARITRKAVDLGSRVAQGSELLTLQAADRYEVILPLALDQVRFLDLPLSGVEPGDGPTVTFSSAIGGRTWTWQGRIVRTAAALAAETRMLQAVATLKPTAETPVLTGLFVDALITGRSEPAVVELPLSVLQTGDEVYVFMPDAAADGNGTLQLRPVEILARDERHVLVRGALSAGERVVAVRVTGVRDGLPARLDRATTTPVEQPAAPQKAAP